MTLSGLIFKLENLPKAIQREVDAIVLEQSPELNREQLSKGKRADDSQISNSQGRSTYSPSYKKKKASRGLQNKFIDLKFTGEFHESIEARKRKKGVYENTSRDTLYTGKLRDEYGKGDTLLGLNTEASEKLENKITEGVKKILKL